MSQIMAHQYMQVGVETDLRPNSSLLNEPHLLVGVKEDGLPAPNVGPSTGYDRSRENHDPVNFAHFSIPRKPVGCNKIVESGAPSASNPAGEENHVVQTAKRSLRQHHILKNW